MLLIMDFCTPSFGWNLSSGFPISVVPARVHHMFSQILNLQNLFFFHETCRLFWSVQMDFHWRIKTQYLYYVNYALSIITWKSSSNNLSNQNKHLCFFLSSRQNVNWNAKIIYFQKYYFSGNTVFRFYYWDYLTNFWQHNFRLTLLLISSYSAYFRIWTSFISFFISSASICLIAPARRRGSAELLHPYKLLKSREISIHV